MSRAFFKLMRAAARITRNVNRLATTRNIPKKTKSRARPRPAQTLAATTASPEKNGFFEVVHLYASVDRHCKIYHPPGFTGQQLPLVVMLHGCGQSPDDFAAGTGMNEYAREQGFVVLYPVQSRKANRSLCWNWFLPKHQQRGQGEPAWLASMTRAIIKQHAIDRQRVYIAGLSAGGSMAAIVATAYPEIFAALGVHSGLPPGAASSAIQAVQVMRNGIPHWKSASLPAIKPSSTIVFHGANDRTVHPKNGQHMIQVLLNSEAALQQSPSPAALRVEVEHGLSGKGRHYTRSTYYGTPEQSLAEHWLVHGSGHAWSGGHSRGSYTDTKGPDATAAMLRFFFERSRKSMRKLSVRNAP